MLILASHCEPDKTMQILRWIGKHVVSESSEENQDSEEGVKKKFPLTNIVGDKL